jgi:carboxymethylenebutenolidase
MFFMMGYFLFFSNFSLMSKILSVIVLLIVGFFQQNQPINPTTSKVSKNDYSDMVMCHTVPTTGMEAFASDPNFQALHPSPAAIHYEGSGQKITFPTNDGKTANGYVLKAKKKSNKWLFVYQEWWGMNEHIMRQADIFYKDLGENVNVLAIDMYDGQTTTDPKEAGALMKGRVEARLESIVKGGMKYAGKRAKIANVGWCFGGAWSLKSALLAEKQTVGSVMYYGMPVKDVEKLKTLNSDVLGLFATEQYISKEIIEAFAANMKTAGKTLTYKIFDGVHGFANPSNPKYDEAASKEAYGMALEYLKKRLM